MKIETQIVQTEFGTRPNLRNSEQPGLPSKEEEEIWGIWGSPGLPSYIYIYMFWSGFGRFTEAPAQKRSKSIYIYIYMLWGPEIPQRGPQRKSLKPRNRGSARNPATVRQPWAPRRIYIYMLWSGFGRFTEAPAQKRSQSIYIYALGPGDWPQNWRGGRRCHPLQQSSAA